MGEERRIKAVLLFPSGSEGKASTGFEGHSWFPLDFLSPPQSPRSLGLLFEATRAVPDPGDSDQDHFLPFYLVPLPALLSPQLQSPHPSQKITVCPSLDHQGHQLCTHSVAPVRVLQFHLQQVQRCSVALVQPRYQQSPSLLASGAGAPWSHHYECQLCDWHRISSDCQSGHPAEGLALGT